MTTGHLDLALEQDAFLGEGLQWRHGRWWWTDIENARLQAWAPGVAVQRWVLSDRLGCFAHCTSGRVLLGLAKRLAACRLGKEGAVQGLQTLTPVDAADPRTRVNDGRTDRRGYFVFGTMNEAPEKRPIGSFYQYSLQHGLRRLALPAVAIANSVCFSLDGRTMYFCDTLSQCIQQCDYDAESAQVANIRPFARIDEAHAWPDGSVVDAEGCLWNAQWGAGQVIRYDPAGRLMQRLKTASAPHTSCPALGGDDGRQLMVTTARQDLSREALLEMPLSGSLFGSTLPATLAVPDALFDDEPGDKK
ncbi:MAG: SMP-30/gluconolactonase/LRE family protein [Paucibacter sp.]|nr:SMP-30/gluconolactonase/LRE family protein [Roseateles sp.]